MWVVQRKGIQTSAEGGKATEALLPVLRADALQMHWSCKVNRDVNIYFIIFYYTSESGRYVAKEVTKKKKKKRIIFYVKHLSLAPRIGSSCL